MLSSNALLKKAKNYKRKEPSILETYKDTIICLKDEKGLNYKEIENFLKVNSIIISSQKISSFIKGLGIKENKVQTLNQQTEETS